MALRHPLLRPGTGGKPDQAAQGATGLRPDRLSLVSRKSGPPRVAHRRLLADADGARGHPQTPAARYGRIHHVTHAPDQGRRPGYRDRNPGSHRIRHSMPRSRTVRRYRPGSATRRTVTGGAVAPEPAPARQLKRRPILTLKSASRIA